MVFRGSTLTFSQQSFERICFLPLTMKVINIDSEILGGTPVFNGTRVPLKNLFDYLETGDSIGEFIEDFPSVQREQVVALLEISQKMIVASTELLHEDFA